MVLGFLNPFKKRDNDFLQFERGLIASEVAGDSARPTNPEADYINMMGKLGPMILDENVVNFLHRFTILHPLIPVFSPLNATIKLDKKQAELKRIRIDNMITELKLTMPVEVYDANGMEILDGLRLFGFDRVSEAVDGWKGHLTTEQVKVIRTEQEKKGVFNR